jgi:enoyl-CoA hydratase/carnithine racemase
MEPTLIRLTATPPIAILELDRKDKRNALSRALRDQLESALARLASDDRVHAVVLTGGPEFFCAGFDLDEMLDTELGALFHRAVEFAHQTAFFEKPLVTAVAGPALAGGFDLALCGDIVLATAGAKLGRPEIKWGVNPFLHRLWSRVGMARAVQISLSGEIFPSDRALSLGLIDRVVPDASLLDEARAEAERLARVPPHAARAIKRAARTIPLLDPRAAVEYELGLTAELACRGTIAEQLRAYRDSVLKRPR